MVLLTGAKQTLVNLQEQGTRFVITTNYHYDDCDLGEGGRAVVDLRNMLGVQSLQARQLVQQSTPFRSLILNFRRKAVLVFSPGLDMDENTDEKVKRIIILCGRISHQRDTTLLTKPHCRQSASTMAGIKRDQL